MASNNEYKVKVGVEFNAQMSEINSQIDQLKKKIEQMGSATGDKSFASGLNKDIQEITNRLNGLRDMTITPSNFNRFQAELQTVNDLIQKVKSSLGSIDTSNIIDKIDAQKQKQNELNQEIQKQDLIIKSLSNKQDRNDAQNKALDVAIDKRKKLTQQLNGHKGAEAKLQKQLDATNQTEKEITDTLEKYDNILKEGEKDGEKFLQGQQQLENSKLAETIKNQVNQYIGLAAIYRYTKKYIQDLVQTYKEFDQSLVAIAAVTGQTRDQMWANIGVYNKMAQSLGTTTQEVINASKLYYQQGLTTTSVLKLTEETVKLATIAELDSADATEYLTTAMNGFKLSAEESTRVTDVWANLAAKTASDVDELAVAISKVASLAENAGMEIETASAFLNQMIETTREAPENLGTALKTIIARFQELKTSEEELSDGVDANKVERALKTAGVALRDASGQFRDFDDVILELSSKWDGLDRNTQRYIATIAAGSRQQSRFIALVSDYEGLLRNVNYAYDSLGSADAQMAVFQEGLAASTNRLQAAWEGLYTSWSESATVISKVIDGMASLVSTLADLGAGTSALLTVAGLLTATIIANALASNLNSLAKKEETLSVRNYLRESKKEIAVDLAKSAAKAILILQYAAIAAGIALVVWGIIKLINYDKEHIKQLEKEATASRQAAAQTKDRASSLGVLATELENVHKASEDESEIRQKIIDQYGSTIRGIDVLTGKYEDLLQALKDEQIQENTLASAQYFDTWSKEAEEAAEKAKDAIEKIYTGESREVTTWDEEGTNLTTTIEPEVKYRYKGKDYNNRAEAEAAALADTKGNLDSARAKYIADTLIGAKDLGSENLDVSSLIQNMLQSSSEGVEHFFEGIERGEGNVITSVKDFNSNFVTELNNLIPQLEQSPLVNQFNTLFNGSLDGLSFDMINQLIQELENSGASQELITYFQNMAGDLQLALRQGFASADVGFWEYTIRSNLLPGAQQAFLNTFNSLKDDPAAQEAYTNSIVGLIHSMNPEEITGAMVEALGDADLATQAFSSLLDGLGNLKDESLAPYFEQLRNVIGQTNAAFEEGKATVDAYYDSMASLADLQKGGMSNEDYLAKLYDEAAALAEVTGEDYNLIVAEMLKATTLDESGQMILQQTDLLTQWADQQYISSEQTVEAKKAELLAYAASMDAIADELDAMANEVEGKGESAEASVDSGNVTIDAARKVLLSENKMGEAAHKAWEKVEGSKNTTAYNAVSADLDKITAKLKTVKNASDIRALANEVRAKALTARAQAAQLNINKLANSFNKAGKSAGKAAKETDKYKDALKELNDKLKEAKEEAEQYIDAVLDALDEKKKDIEDAQKLMEEAFEAERRLLKIQLQAWRDYNEAQQQGALDALELQGKAADMYFNQEIAAIQAKIDALDDEAEAEDRLLKLQKARDDYNKAQNSRTRLVLTKGAGWIFKTDQNEVTNARKALNDVQREIQKANYQKQLDDLQAQATAWQEIAEKIGESAAEAGKLAEALERFHNGDNGYNDFDAYTKAVEDQQKANDTYAALIEKIDKQLEQADWTFEDYQDSQDYEDAYKRIFNGDPETEINGPKLDKQLEDFITKLKENQVIYEEQKDELQKIADTKEFYNLQKTQLGLTQAQLDKAEEIRQAIFDSYDKSSENLGLGEDSKYYKSNILGLIEETKKLAEQIAELEAKQALEAELQANTGGGGSAGGGGSSSGGGGIIIASPVNSGGNNTSNTNPTYGNRVLDAIRNGQYGSINNNQAVNAIRDSYTAGAYSTSYANNITTYHFNVGTVNTKATDAAGFAADLKRLNYLNQ